MTYILRGSLNGALCDDCAEPLAGLKVRLYSLRQGQDGTRLAVADAKSTYAILSDEQVAVKQSALLGEFDIDEAGQFTASLPDGGRYMGEAFEVDVYCATVPRRPSIPRPGLSVQFSVTTVQPQWRSRETQNIAAWEHTLSKRLWCHIRSLFDAWTICGRVTVCASSLPAEGVRVFALDRDWLVDDALGSAVTDANGRYRIDYLGADFRRGTFSNIELFGGPDVYFRIETQSGSVLLAEPSSAGRAPGRENVGPCFCADLCVREAPEVEHAWFTRVGDFSINSDISAATGLTTSGQPNGFPNQHGGPGYAFWRSPKLVGDCPTRHPATSQPMRYRFLWRVTGSAAAAQPITGPAMVVAQKVGSRPVAWNFGSGLATYAQEIWVVPSGGYLGPLPAPFPPAPPGPPAGSWGAMPPLLLQPDADGWVAMPPDATNQGFSGTLLRINSAALVPGGVPPAPNAGDPVLPANQRLGVDIEIAFEAAPVSGPGLVIGNSMPRMHVNNWIEVAQFNLDQFTAPGATPCSGISNAVDIRYTMDHELVADWRLDISTSASIPGGTPVLPRLGLPPAAGQFVSVRGGHGLVHLDTTAWPQCAYMVTFTRMLKLTDGETDDSGRGGVAAVFCKR